MPSRRIDDSARLPTKSDAPHTLVIGYVQSFVGNYLLSFSFSILNAFSNRHKFGLLALVEQTVGLYDTFLNIPKNL